MTLSLVLSLSRPSWCTGDAQDIMPRATDEGDRRLGSPTPLQGAGQPRLSPRMSLIRWTVPLAHVEPEESLAEPQALLLGLAGGRHDLLVRHSWRVGHPLHYRLGRRT